MAAGDEVTRGTPPQGSQGTEPHAHEGPPPKPAGPAPEPQKQIEKLREKEAAGAKPDEIVETLNSLETSTWHAQQGSNAVLNVQIILRRKYEGALVAAGAATEAATTVYKIGATNDLSCTRGFLSRQRMSNKNMSRNKTTRVAVHISLDPEIWKKAQRQAIRDGLSTSRWLEQLIRASIARREREPEGLVK